MANSIPFSVLKTMLDALDVKAGGEGADGQQNQLVTRIKHELDLIRQMQNEIATMNCHQCQARRVITGQPRRGERPLSGVQKAGTKARKPRQHSQPGQTPPQAHPEDAQTCIDLCEDEPDK